MKKKLVVLLAALMMLGSTTTALAAGSIAAGDLSSAAGNTNKVAAMTDAEATEVAKDLVVDKEDLSGATDVVEKVEAVDGKTLKSAAAAVEKLVKAEYNVDLTEDVKAGETKVTAAIVAIMDITVKEGTVGDVALTFPVEGVKANENVRVLHFNGTEWEQVEVNNVADGAVTATFTSFSPVAIVRIASTTQKDADLFVLPMMAATGLVGAAVCRKKSK